MDRLFRLNWFGGPTDKIFKPTVNENHIFSLAALIVIVLILSVLIYLAVKRQSVQKSTSGGLLLVEVMIDGSDQFISEIHESKFDKMNPYFISIFVFFLFGNLLSLIGLTPIATNISIIFAATFITWVGTMVVGLVFNKFAYLFEKMLNPLELVSNVSPLISLTFRMFGNIIGGTVLVTLGTLFFNYIWSKIIGVSSDSVAAQINPLGVLLIPAFNLYFDLFDSFIQATVFIILSISYWSQAASGEEKENHKKHIRAWKKEVIKNKHKKELQNSDLQTNSIQTV
ncbi:F0F1 ATP synthase subunit A [Mycoplasma struthionis]|uniref:F0F1 ATP synthase subunit A n=1 Tax=Mycoplasma struthionis TaxID=538220 RepID=A0A3G8LGQ1_9MOLU|nr:F0F1 ATP synthase subunit A [Mycoplasma struthionis]AZG68691.1 F0F1 ATP synthase subunit A [Mycoplasma struthionis]